MFVPGERTMSRNQVTRTHLKNVYGSISAAILAAAVGYFIHHTGLITGGSWSSIVSFTFIVWLWSTTRDTDGENDIKRLSCLCASAFFFGMSTGSLIDTALNIEPSIVFSALVCTSIIFICFYTSILIAPDGKFLWLGPPLTAIFVLTTIASIFNSFKKLSTLTYAQLICGPLIESAFIIYDTQIILERVRTGDRDYIWHAFLFFWDLGYLFIDILSLLIDKEERRKKNR